jgi:membrane associated rhomboid family serine protease
MRGRYPATQGFSYSFGPGPLTPAIKILIGVNVLMFVLTVIMRGAGITDLLGLQPQATLEGLRIWQPFTYMFLHGGFFHILFNMLTLWMFGTELERMWGSRFFVKYYFVTGLGAAATQIILSFVPGGFGDQMYFTTTIGASGAVYGVLLAYALYFPTRPIYMYFVFPIPAKYFVMILGALTFMISPGSNVSNAAHLGGLIFGYVYLKSRQGGGGGSLVAEIKYRYLKWKMNRLRRKFDVYSGGKSSWDKNVH